VDQLTRLLLDAQRGDRAALERFVAATHDDVLAICRYLGDRDTADDLAQEAYERAFASLHRFRATGPAKHWLLTIARRTCADETRRRTRRRRTERRVLGQPDTVTAHGSPDASPPELDELLHELDDERRAAFVLTQLNGLRYEEAAELLGVPIGTIRSRVARAREQLMGAINAAHDAADGNPNRDGGEPEQGLRRPG
jgi:RNA polymerase sigma-70 factor (ECF subfamily)